MLCFVFSLLFFNMLELAGIRKKHEIDLSSLKKKQKSEPMPKGIYKHIALGSGTGTVIGILPGEGATIAAFISYNISKRISKNGPFYPSFS